MMNSLAERFPEIAKEWHPTKNGNLTPLNIASKSNKKFWFICEKDHEWEANLNNRTSSFRGDFLKGTGCPYCNNKKAHIGNCLSTLNPEIAKEWHPTKNGKLTPLDVMPKSHKKVWFICEEDHEWVSTVAHRVNKRRCPYCSRKKVCSDNCLFTTHPEIAKEWHPTKNGYLTPHNVLAGTAKKFWFICEKSHEWEASLYSRTNPIILAGCPYCLNKTEQKCREIFENIFNLPFPRYRPKFLKGLEYDGASIELKFAFEYDGEFHYKPHYASKNPEESLKNQKYRDYLKDKLSLENGWSLIRISYKDIDDLEGNILNKIRKLI